MSNHLFDAIRAAMPADDATFLSTSAGLRLTYGDLLARSGQMANLLAQSGVAPGDRVAVQVEKSPDAILLYLACVRAGAIFLPLNTAYTLNEVEYFVGDAEPALVICSADRVPAITAMGPKADTLSAFAARAADQASDFVDVARGPDDLAAILYTSGTTGRSKGAMLSHRNLASNASTLVKAWAFTRSDVLLHALPIFHTHGLFVATNVILLSGASMIFLARFDPAEILQLLPRATVMMGVPTFYVRLLQDPGLDQAVTSNIRLFVSGSAPLLAETHDAWRLRTGHAILERYGMTETNMNTSNPYDGPRVAGTVGPPLPGVEVRVVDPETGCELPNGEIGMIEIRGPNVFQGYWRMPEKTAAEFRPDGFFISGDLGLIDAAGYVHISGRGKDLVISGGYNVYPKEVEGEIDALDGVVESAVIGLPHRDFGEGVTAVVVRKPGAMLGEADILARLDGRLARYKQPKRVLFVDDLPRNTMGKVQKNVLRETYKDLYAG